MYMLQRLNVVKETDSEVKAKKLRALGYTDVEVVAEEAPKAEKTIDEMTLPELKDHAKANNIDLGEATRKDDILARIKKEEDGE